MTNIYEACDGRQFTDYKTATDYETLLQTFVLFTDDGDITFGLGAAMYLFCPTVDSINNFNYCYKDRLSRPVDDGVPGLYIKQEGCFIDPIFVKMSSNE